MNFDHTYHVPGVNRNILLDNSHNTTRGCGPVKVTKAEDMTDEELIRYGFDVEKIRNRHVEESAGSDAPAKAEGLLNDESSRTKHGAGRRFDNLFKSVKKSERLKKSSANGIKNSVKTNSRPCIVDGVRYDTIVAAAKGSGLNRSTLGHALGAGRSELSGHSISYDIVSR